MSMTAARSASARAPPRGGSHRRIAEAVVAVTLRTASRVEWAAPARLPATPCHVALRSGGLEGGLGGGDGIGGAGGGAGGAGGGGGRRGGGGGVGGDGGGRGGAHADRPKPPLRCDETCPEYNAPQSCGTNAKRRRSRSKITYGSPAARAMRESSMHWARNNTLEYRKSPAGNAG
eukprot:scaffold120873_cov29-Tisochrysis_lutea.AAC.2